MGSISSNYFSIHGIWNFSYALHKPHNQEELQGITHHYICTVIAYLYILFKRKLWTS